MVEVGLIQMQYDLGVGRSWADTNAAPIPGAQ